jgi:hypothetical protein
MGNLDNGPGRMNNVNWNENPVMRQPGDFNDRIIKLRLWRVR